MINYSYKNVPLRPAV